MRNDNNWMRNYVRYSSLMLQMIIIIVVGVYGGYRLDLSFSDGKHWFLILLTIVSTFVALYLFIKDLLKKG
ncbi:MAG TPA: AtpZ/AtpI family protein [Bacteroidales bacterium]|nr:AtpZ/AtpI family protein [Bacteroidales bacterium]